MNQAGLQTNFVDTLFGWPAGYSYTFDPEEIKIDSVWVSATNNLVNSYNEAGRRLIKYITPYGNYLDLGPDGFTWVYDVTDFEPWLHDTIDLEGGDHRELIDLRFDFISGTAS